MEESESVDERKAAPTQAQGGLTGFHVLDVAVAFIELMPPVIEAVHGLDRSLADQVKRGSESIVLNVAEGRRRTGKDRLHCFRIASGSAEEVRAALRVARVWRYVSPEVLDKPLGLLDRVLAMLWRLERR